MGIADEEEEGRRTFPVFCKYVIKEENVRYEEMHVGSGFAVQILECFGLSRGGLSSWRALARANYCQQCVSQHCAWQGILLDPSSKHWRVRLGTAAHRYFSLGEDMLSLVRTWHISSKSSTGFSRFSFKFLLDLKILVKSSMDRALNWDFCAVDLHGNPCASFSSLDLFGFCRFETHTVLFAGGENGEQHSHMSCLR